MERKITVTAVNTPGSHLGYLGCLCDSGSEIYAAGGSYHKPTLLRSDDRGASWKLLPRVSAAGLREAFVAGDRLFVVGESGFIGTSTDRGETFTVAGNTTSGCLYRIVEHAGTFWVCADDGLLLASGDGVAWERRQTTSTGRILDLAVVDGTLYFLDTTGMIFRHAGETWEPLSLRAKRPLTQLIVTSKGTWLASGDGGGIFRSTDKGFTWKASDTGTSSDLEGLIEHKGSIVAVGDGGTVLFSDDDGVSFAVERTKMEKHLWSIIAVDGALLVGGDNGAIWRMALEVGTQPVAGVPFIPLSL